MKSIIKAVFLTLFLTGVIFSQTKDVTKAVPDSNLVKIAKEFNENANKIQQYQKTINEYQQSIKNLQDRNIYLKGMYDALTMEEEKKKLKK